ncbi:hypothetical protein GCM10009738_50500 [Kitasatospora viridis]|uniref:D-mannose binding lectin n=2 Tax=Kitasatospora viridis TaxID=281105 RepID=A0A561UF84_9ACTN|nr:D-mannose binding lectin [Kitasatospora viridis]
MAAGGTQAVDYHGYHLTVPADWQVVDLSQNPHTCVRFDRHAVYLGTPGAEQDCPAHLSGRTDAVLIQPVPAPTPSRPAAPVVDPGAPLPAKVLAAGAVDHWIAVQLRGTGLQLTAGYPDSPDQLNGILAAATTGTPTPAAQPSTTPRTAAAAPTGTPQPTGTPTTAGTPATTGTPQPTGTPATTPQTAGAAPAVRTTAVTAAATTVIPATDDYTQGFDACAAPSAGQMQAWMANSPYRSVGIYIGGPAQACPTGTPDAGWVSSRAQEGWSFLPIYVGHQVLSKDGPPIAADLPTATQQGTTEGQDAVAKAGALGFQQGAVVYDDLENYDRSQPGYSDRVLAYLNGWISAVKSAGFRAGVYSGPYSGLADLAAHYNDSSFPRPDVVWSAAWNSYHDTSDAGTGIPTGLWPAARRVHQWGNGTQSWGGVSMNIDGDAETVATTATGTWMAPGQMLEAGGTLSSSTALFGMGGNGDLTVSVLTGGGHSQWIWHTNTQGNSGAYAVMQRDGNLVVYTAAGPPLWGSGTNGQPGNSLTVQDDGNVVVRQASGTPVWHTATYARSATMNAGGGLSSGTWTQGALTRLVMNPNGNLAMYRTRDGALIWQTGTGSANGAYLTMQTDGNLVAYQQGGGPSTGGAIWNTATWGNPGAYAIMQDDGNLVVYKQGGSSSAGGALWASNTWSTAP